MVMPPRIHADRLAISRVIAVDAWSRSCGQWRSVKFPDRKGDAFMRSTQYLLAAALTVGISAPALAQTTTTPVNTTPAPTNQSSTVGHWTATGFVGGSFSTGTSATLVGPAGNAATVDFNNNGGVNYGGAISYQYHNWVGGEFLTSFSPSFDVNTVAINNDRNPHLDTYMFNAIGLIPVGEHIQPYISGGIGTVTLSADVLTVNGILVTRAGTVANVESTRATHHSFGQDIGGGVMAFANNWIGFRGDVRYYHASTDNNLLNANDDIQVQFIRGLLSGVHFWRADGGVTFRW
jgi:opacity protein-like surface antigen